MCNEAVIEAIVETAIERGVCKLRKQPGSSITNAEYGFLAYALLKLRTRISGSNSMSIEVMQIGLQQSAFVHITQAVEGLARLHCEP